MRLPAPPILIITDRTQCSEPLEKRAEALFRGGCRWLSLREKNLAAGKRAALLGRLIEAAAPYAAFVGVHGDLEAAMAHRCPLHLSADADAEAARRILGPDVLIGQSCHDRAELRKAAAAGVDYSTLSPAFASVSKPAYAPIEIHDFAAIARSAEMPVLALGGITETTLPRLKNMGIGGVAIMGEAMRTLEPENWFGRVAAHWRALYADKV